MRRFKARHCLNLPGQRIARSSLAGGPQLAMQLRAKASHVDRPSKSNQRHVRERNGFSRFDYGLEWYLNKEKLLEADPGPVLVGTSYVFQKASGSNPGPVQVMKYASFDSHWSYWEEIRRNLKQNRLQSFHEVIPENAPRCLYFDLDGDSAYRDLHELIVQSLSSYVRWFFSGDQNGWGAEDPEPVVMLSSSPSKYSCHVVFPQIQFSSFEEQAQYVTVLLTGLPALQVELEDGESIPILERLVDRVPYTKFQLFRGPYACKMKDGEIRPETQFVPVSFFQNDQRSCFASYVDPDWALNLASVDELLQHNDELRSLHQTHMNRMPISMGGTASHQDQLCLYDPVFQRRGGGFLDFAGRPDLEVYQDALKWLDPERAKQWWSWFRISGVTFTLLEKYQDNPDAREKIWRAHFQWSSRYENFSEAENVYQVERSRGKRVSGLPLLQRLVRFDNPDMRIRFSTFETAQTHSNASQAAAVKLARINGNGNAQSRAAPGTVALAGGQDGVAADTLDDPQVDALKVDRHCPWLFHHAADGATQKFAAGV